MRQVACQLSRKGLTHRPNLNRLNVLQGITFSTLKYNLLELFFSLTQQIELIEHDKIMSKKKSLKSLELIDSLI